MSVTKLCRTCGLTLPGDAFYRSKKGCHLGLANRCKRCQREYHRVWSLRNRDRVQAAHRKYRETDWFHEVRQRYQRTSPIYKEHQRIYQSRQISVVSRGYAAHLLGISIAEVTPEILAMKQVQVEVKRMALLLKQALKQRGSK